MTTQKKINKSSFCKVSSPSETGEGNSTLHLEEMLLLASKLFTHTYEELLDNECEMRTGMKNTKDIRKRKSKRKPQSHSRHKKKGSQSEKAEEVNKLQFELLFKHCAFGDPALKGTVLFQNLSERTYLAFLLGLKYCKENPEWDELREILGFYPQKLSQGFINLGNTCYMNAILQALLSIPSFAEDLLNQSFYGNSTDLNAFNMCLTELLILKDVDIRKVKELLLGNIMKRISAVSSVFSGNTQNDAYEFLSHCLNLMQENRVTLNTIRQRKTESEEENSPQQVFADSAATNLLTCPVITNFEFELLASIICKECGHIVLKTEVSNSLSISIPSERQALPVSIQSALDIFFKAEELEYECEKCKCKSSVLQQKLIRLPRVLIVHLKRYSFNEFFSLSKDNQEVAIPRYLTLSPYCNGNTKPPVPLSKNAHSTEFQVLKLFEKVYSETISSLTPSTNLTSASKDSLAPHVGSDKESEPQKYQMPCKGSSSEQQQTGPGTKLSTVESKLTNAGDGAAPEKKLFAADLIMSLENIFASLMLEGERTNDSDASLAKVHPEEMLANPKQKRDEKDNECVDFESVFKSTEYFSEDKESRIMEEFQKAAEQIQQSERVRIYKQAPQLALLQSLLNPNAQECTENLRTPTKLNLQKASVNSVGALGSNENPGDKDVEKTEAKAKQRRRSPKVEHCHTYWLIAVVSHLGATSSSGHYITDAYDFESQGWFTYNDLQVSGIQEHSMLKARLCSGYIFFYMHNKIFEELLEREKISQCGSKKEK
ncbi:hypothetical protein MC885_021484 [Smutsia gigantea]|nr:hypothetical protein MC885_021484 [Smutsia gigantea]